MFAKDINVRWKQEAPRAFLVLSLFSALNAYAGAWFEPCSVAAKKSKKAYDFLWVDTKCSDVACNDIFRYETCFLLNSKELLYEDKVNGTNFQGLYYRNLDKLEVEAEKLTSSVMSISEFISTNAKRYAILKDGWINYGIQNEAVYLLYLVPGSERAFRLVNLFEKFDNEGCAGDSGAMGCGPLEYGCRSNAGDGVVAELTSERPFPPIEGPLLIWEGKSVSAFEFNVRPTQAEGAQALRYVLSSQKSPFTVFNLSGIVRRLKNELAPLSKH